MPFSIISILSLKKDIWEIDVFLHGIESFTYFYYLANICKDFIKNLKKKTIFHDLSLICIIRNLANILKKSLPIFMKIFVMLYYFLTF